MKKRIIINIRREWIVFLLVVVLILAGTSVGSADNLYLHSESVLSTSDEPVNLSAPWTDGVIWTPVSNAGQPFGRAGKGFLGEYFYVFGCLTKSQAQAFNWTTDHWQLSAVPPEGFCNYCGVTTAEAIYLIGWYADFQVGNEVQKFVPTAPPEGEWTTVASYPLEACGIAAAWDGDNYIYACGGGDIIDIFDQAYRYDILSDQWEPIALVPAPMMYHGGAFIYGEFHVIGGTTGDGVAHYAYNPATDSWEAKAELPVENHFALFSLTSNMDYIFSVGGGGGYYIYPATDAVQIYDPALDSWSLETPLPEAYGMNSAAVAAEGIVVSGGGYSGSGYVQYTYRGNGFPGAVSVRDKHSGESAPRDFTFKPPFPNPFNPETNLEFSLPYQSDVTLRIYDIGGSEVINLFNGQLDAGFHHMTFNGEQLSSGVYFAVLLVDGIKITKKLLLLK